MKIDRTQYVDATKLGQLGSSYRLFSTFASGFFASCLVISVVGGVIFLLMAGTWKTLAQFGFQLAAVGLGALLIVAPLTYITAMIPLRGQSLLALAFAGAGLVGSSTYALSTWILQIPQALVSLASTHQLTLTAYLTTVAFAIVGIPFWLVALKFPLAAIFASTRSLHAIRLPLPSPTNFSGMVRFILGAPEAYAATAAAVFAKALFAFGVVSVVVLFYKPSNTIGEEVLQPCVEAADKASGRPPNFLSSSAYRRSLTECLSANHNAEERSGLLIISCAFGLLWGVLAIFWSSRLFKQYRRTANANIARERMHDPRAPILYLRPFGLDSALFEDAIDITPSQFFSPVDSARSLSELLRFTLLRAGPVVALASPKATDPLAVASERYSEQDWRPAVEKFATEASLIVFVVSNSPGVDWEIQHLSSQAHWPKTLTLFAEDYDWPRVQAFASERYDIAISKPRTSKTPIAIGAGKDGAITLYFGKDRKMGTFHSILVDHTNRQLGRSIWQ